MRGYLEAVGSTHARGWAEYHESAPAQMLALLENELLGHALADQPREDVRQAAVQDGYQAGAFFLVFSRALSAQEQARVQLRAASGQAPLPRLAGHNPPSQPKHPLLIVGSACAGAGILTRALRAAGYAGFGEGNFLSILNQITDAVENHFRDLAGNAQQTMAALVGKEALKQRLAATLREIIEPLHQGQPWLDKTAGHEIIAAIPALRTLWPESLFIFSKCRGIENIIARLKKFPQRDFKYHCYDWARTMAAWRQLRAAQPDLPCLEIEQGTFAENPRALATALTDFLNLQESAGAEMAGIFASEPLREAAQGYHARALALAQTGWSAQQQEVFQLYCGPEMLAWHYTEDAATRTRAPDVASPAESF